MTLRHSQNICFTGAILDNVTKDTELVQCLEGTQTIMKWNSIFITTTWSAHVSKIDGDRSLSYYMQANSCLFFFFLIPTNLLLFFS